MKHFALAAAFVLITGAANAAVIGWTASLDPGQEVQLAEPAPGASGSGTGTLDTESGFLTWNISWSGLTGTAQRLHFHNASVGVNGPIIVSIFDFVPTDSPVSGSDTLDPGEIAEFRAGNVYLNLHTVANPGGEIRGQVDAAPIPVPATLPLLLGAAALLGLAARRKS